ncbi:nucleotide sugar dehydrogenase [Zavarzinella formosa]|uniref:nucleotide sugar dehydrogenase n=1 Tax=Zavarzinella formosa TaxID=360055 RepID=UPI000314BF0A|nr:nucleotide sugar dehydrogenase [Zavarzinella formosa]
MSLNHEEQTALAGKFAVDVLERRTKICFVGMGRSGLTLAETFTNAGFSVLGFDFDAVKIEKLKNGEIEDGVIPPETAKELFASGRFDSTSDSRRFREADAIIFCVPTPLKDTRQPDMSLFAGGALALRPQLRPGQLIILTGGAYPGATEELFLPALAVSGLAAGCDYFLAYSPELGNSISRTDLRHRVPRVIGAIDGISLGLAATLFGPVSGKLTPVEGIRVAEACPIVESARQVVNTALVRELKSVFEAMGINACEVLDATNVNSADPVTRQGIPGQGSRHWPASPFHLTWAARRHGCDARLIELAGEVMAAMPACVFQRIGDALNEIGKPIKNSRILLLGAACDKDVSLSSGGLAPDLIEMLRQRGAEVSYNDPSISRLEIKGAGNIRLDSRPLSAELLAEQDCVVIVTDHSAYDLDWILGHATVVIDTRNTTGPTPRGPCRVWKA